MKWLIFIISVIASGIDLPRALWKDRLLFKDFLHQRPGDLDPSAKYGGETIDPASYDETIDSYRRVMNWRNWGRLPHHLRNVTHEWCDARPKLASKFLPALIVWPWLIAAVVAVF